MKIISLVATTIAFIFTIYKVATIGISLKSLIWFFWGVLCVSILIKTLKGQGEDGRKNE